MALIGHIRRKKGGRKGGGFSGLPPDDPPVAHAPPIMSKEDVRVEAELVAKGVKLEETQRKWRSKGPSAGRTLQAIEDEISADPGLVGRPQVRWARMLMATAHLRNLDGSPVVDKNGKRLDQMTIRELLIHVGMISAINQSNPHQYEFWRDLVWLLCDKPREAVELSGPGGGPIRSESRRLESLSDEEVAAKMVRATRIAQAVLEGKERPPSLADAIEVTGTPVIPAEVPKGNATFEAVPAPEPGQPNGPPPAATAPAPQRSLPALPTGMIPTNRR